MYLKNIALWVTRTGTRKTFLALLTFVLTAWISLVTIWRIESDSSLLLTNGELMTRIAVLPAFASAFALLLATIVASLPAKSGEFSPVPQAQTQANHFQAQVVGVQWMNPLHRMDYPTEWQLLWTLNLVKPNVDDDMVKKNPERYGSLKAVGSIVDGGNGQTSLKFYFQVYVETLVFRHRDKYFSNERYFYNAHAIEDKSTRRELAGIRVEFALPEGQLNPSDEANYIRETIISAFDIGNPNFPNSWTRSTPPDVRITQGGADAGFTSLTQALDYLQQHPSETVWVMNWDAPSRPLDEQINENLVLLVLAGPDYKTGRAPLAWLSYPAQVKVQDVASDGSTPRQIQAWKTTLEKAAQNAGKRPTDIGFVIHDANSTHPQSSDRLAGLARTVTENIPDLDFIKQTFNTSALLGEMRAGSALTNVALAIGYANHIGATVLVAGTTDLEQPTATIVTPPAIVRPIDANAPWFRARGANNAYMTWWGVRHDARPNMQGYSQ